MRKPLVALVSLSWLASVPLLAMSADKTVEVTNFPVVQSVDGVVSVDNFPVTQDVTGSVEVSNLPVDAAGNLRVAEQQQTLPEIFAYMTDVQVPPGSLVLTKQVSIPAGKRLVIEQLGVTGTAPIYPEPQNGELNLDLGPPGDRSRPHFTLVIERVRQVGPEHLLNVAPQRVLFRMDGPRTFQLRVQRDQTFGWYITNINLYGYLIDLPN